MVGFFCVVCYVFRGRGRSDERLLRLRSGHRRAEGFCFSVEPLLIVCFHDFLSVRLIGLFAMLWLTAYPTTPCDS